MACCGGCRLVLLLGLTWYFRAVMGANLKLVKNYFIFHGRYTGLFWVQVYCSVNTLNSFINTASTTVTLSSVSRDVIRTTNNAVKCSLTTLRYQYIMLLDWLGATQPSIPPGSVNEYQLRLGKQRQVWFIPLADERGVCR